MKTYKPEFTQEDVNNIGVLLNVAVKNMGLEGNADIAARQILNKIAAGEVIPPENNKLETVKNE